MPERILGIGVRERYYDAPRPTATISASRDLILGDLGMMLVYAGGGDITLTIPDNPEWVQDGEVDILQIGTGKITITAIAPLTIVRAGGFTIHTLAGTGCAAFLKLVAPKTWFLAGNFY